MNEIVKADYQNLVDICKLSFSALKLDDVVFVIDSDSDNEDGEAEQALDIFLLPDTLLPIIAITTNALAYSLFENKFNDEVAFAFDIIKDEFETLCYSRIIKNNKKEMDYIKQCLVTAEVISQTFKPDINRKINVTKIIMNWREFLTTHKDGKVIDYKTIYNKLIDFNLDNTSIKQKRSSRL